MSQRQRTLYFASRYNQQEHLLKGWLSTVDLLVLTSLDQLVFIPKILLTFAAKQATSNLNEEVNGTRLSLQLVFPGIRFEVEVKKRPN